MLYNNGSSLEGESHIADNDALAGVKILDFSWNITGPLATKWLAEFGATVIKIESLKRPDILRTFMPMAGGIPGINRCAAFSFYNDNKYSVALMLSILLLAKSWNF